MPAAAVSQLKGRSPYFFLKSLKGRSPYFYYLKPLKGRSPYFFHLKPLKARSSTNVLAAAALAAKQKSERINN